MKIGSHDPAEAKPIDHELNLDALVLQRIVKVLEVFDELSEEGIDFGGHVVVSDGRGKPWRAFFEKLPEPADGELEFSHVVVKVERVRAA